MIFLWLLINFLFFNCFFHSGLNFDIGRGQFFILTLLYFFRRHLFLAWIVLYLCISIFIFKYSLFYYSFPTFFYHVFFIQIRLNIFQILAYQSLWMFSWGCFLYEFIHCTLFNTLMIILTFKYFIFILVNFFHMLVLFFMLNIFNFIIIIIIIWIKSSLFIVSC